jgi:DNA-binding NtrC family response regulator
MLPTKVLLVDDEPGPRFGVRRFLKSHGFEVEEADDLASARTALRLFVPDVTILDFRLPDGTALDFIPHICDTSSSSIIVLTAYATIDTAVEAVKLGADQFLTKPVELQTLRVVIERLVENQRNRRQMAAGVKRGELRDRIDPFLGETLAIGELREKTGAVLRTDSPLLIQGETGTGKTELAKWIHRHSRRSDEAFVDLNCAGISREFLETELFGHEKGAFTGASGPKQGLLEAADRGTVFLDEIGDMDSQVQASVLKVLEEKRFRRLGDVRDRSVDIRLIAATHHDLGTLVAERRFRQDLYYRISALELRVPPLRERRDDIATIAARLVERLSRDLGQRPVAISADAEEALRRYSWPGNIRELRNILERALLRTHGDVLDARALDFPSLPAAPAASAPGNTLRRDGTLDDVERDYLEQVLRDENGAIDRVAERLGISRSAVYYKARKHGIDVASSRG